MEASPIYTFFLVDDDIAFLNLMGRILESRGHKVLMAHSGTSAIIDIPSEKLDCVITDYQMVGMDGIELVRDLRESSAMQNVKIIMVSGETDNAAITLNGLNDHAGQMPRCAGCDGPVKIIQIGLWVVTVRPPIGIRIRHVMNATHERYVVAKPANTSQ